MKSITVLMGIYNCEDTIEEALNSLLAQTYTNWKCVLCDDGSSDNTVDIAKKYVENFPDNFILIINEKNLGLNKTLNKCLELANTEYVARMDGDDISLPSRFEKEINFLDNNREFDIVSTPMIQFDEQGVFRVGKALKINPSISDVITGSYICHAPSMIRTEAIKAVGGYSTNDKTLRVEDVDLWIRLYLNGSRCHIMDEPLYKMRDDRNAVARRKFKYRVNSSRVRLIACKKAKLNLKSYIKCLEPIIIGLLPNFLYTFFHKKKR